MCGSSKLSKEFHNRMEMTENLGVEKYFIIVEMKLKDSNKKKYKREAGNK